MHNLSIGKGMQLKNKCQGFSLVEMMVVIAILGIIASIAIPSYLNHVEKTRLTQARAVVTQVQQEVQRVKLVEGTLGATSTDVVAKVQSIVSGANAQGLIAENDLNRFYNFNVTAGEHTGQYFFDVSPINVSKKGLYMDQSGNTFKCPDASSVSSHSGCEKM